MKELINRLTDYVYSWIKFKELLNNIKTANYRYILKSLLYNIGKSPLKWLICITILLSFFLFDTFWEAWINKIWVEPIASQIKDNTWWVVIIYSIIVSAYYYHSFLETEMINKNRCKAVMISALLYCFCLFSGKWDYVLMFDCCRYFAWSNLVFIIPLIWELYICYQLKHKKATDSIKPELEIEHTNNVNDSYKRKAVCESAYTVLKSCFYGEGSFTFSIIGIWGSGKTTFINALKEQYKSEQDVKSIIIFEPWKNDSPDSIIRGFFAMLRDELSNYIPHISSMIDQYVELLLDEESAKPLKIIGRSLHDLIKEEKNPYELIKEILERSKHKIVVFIDDIDRLNAAEIREVLRLIRNTANFPYIQFIVAYDKNYVCETLRNNGINTPNRYLEKFFNVEMSLPKSEERVICEELLTRIQETINIIWGLEKDDMKIANMVYYRSDDSTNSIIDNNLVVQVLFTVRDVIRFHNSFYLLAKAYKDQNVEKEVCFQDLFFLELLRYRYLEIYTILCNKPFVLLHLSDYMFILNKDYEKTLQEYVDSSQVAIISDILEYLFKDRKKNNAIYCLRSYYKYFMYRLDDRILTVDELMSLSDKDDSEIIESANQLYKSKYDLEFETQIEELLMQIYRTDEEGKTLDYIKIYNLLERLAKSNNNGLRAEIFNAIITHLQYLRYINNRHLKALLHLYDIVDFSLKTIKYFDISKFLKSILIRSSLTEILGHPVGQEEHDIVYDFLSNTLHPVRISPALSLFMKEKSIKNDLLIDLSTLSDLLLKYFKDEKNKLSDNGFILFYNSTTKINEQSIRLKLRKEALDLMKTEIIKNPIEYFRRFIHTDQSSDPEWNTVSPEPCCNEIFGSNEKFEKFLSSCKSNNQEVIKVKNYWELYKYNGYHPIEFERQGNVQDKINNCFRHEIVLLNQLKDIMKQIKRDGKINEDSRRQLNYNSLYIKLRAEIYELIEKS